MDFSCEPGARAGEGGSYRQPQHGAGKTACRPACAKEEPKSTGSHVLTYAARIGVFDEGDLAGTTYEVVEGQVMSYKLLPDGRRQITEVLHAGDVFGLAMGRTCDVGAETLTPVKLAAYGRSEIESDPSLRDRLFGRVQAQIAVLHDHLLLLGRMTAQERVSTFLMRLLPTGERAERRRAPGARAGADVPLPMSRQEIADYLGLTIETVSRAFAAMRRGGIIAYDRQDRVTIPDIDRLSRMTGAN